MSGDSVKNEAQRELQVLREIAYLEKDMHLLDEALGELVCRLADVSQSECPAIAGNSCEEVPTVTMAATLRSIRNLAYRITEMVRSQLSRLEL